MQHIGENPHLIFHGEISKYIELVCMYKHYGMSTDVASLRKHY